VTAIVKKAQHCDSAATIASTRSHTPAPAAKRSSARVWPVRVEKRVASDGGHLGQACR
jgi:hypothetical protein